MIPIYTFEKYPAEAETLPSIFLVGPTPRDNETPSWRPKALQLLGTLRYDGFVFVPENRQGEKAIIDEDAPIGERWMQQVEWERKGLEMATVIAAWVPRQLDSMPAFTTNVEFGRYVTSGRLLYGRPNEASKTRYLDWLYSLETRRKPHNDLVTFLAEAAQLAHANYFTP